MTPQGQQTLAMIVAVTGLACFLWPTIRRLRGFDAAGAPTGVRSRLWWLGLVLTVVAMGLLRGAAGG